MDGKCYCCGKLGHKSPNYNKKNKIPREEWAINKAQLAQANESMSTSKGADQSSTQNRSAKSNKTEHHIGWAGVHCSFIQSADLRDYILLNSDSTDTIFAMKHMCLTFKRQESNSWFSPTEGSWSLMSSVVSLILGHTGSMLKQSPTLSASMT
eukprot:9183771-Ditylum_brightwellii.AAC.1